MYPGPLPLPTEKEVPSAGGLAGTPTSMMPTHPASAYRGSAARYTGASRGPSPARCRSPTGHPGGARGAPPPPRTTDAGDGGQVHAPAVPGPGGGTGERGPLGEGLDQVSVPGEGLPPPAGRTEDNPIPGTGTCSRGWCWRTVSLGVPVGPRRQRTGERCQGHRGMTPHWGIDRVLRCRDRTGAPRRRPGCRRTRTGPRPDRPPGFNISRPRPRTAIRRWSGAPGRTANVPDAPGGRRTGCSRGDAPGRTANSIPTSGAPGTGSCSRGPPANSATRSTPLASSSPMSRCAGAGGARALGESDASNPPGPGTAGGVYPVAWTGTSPGTFGPGRHPDVPLPGWRPSLPARSGPVPPCLIRYAIPGGYSGTNICALAPPPGPGRRTPPATSRPWWGRARRTSLSLGRRTSPGRSPGGLLGGGRPPPAGPVPAARSGS